jgi:hypothetical protein
MAGDRENGLRQMSTVALFIVKPSASATRSLPAAAGKSLKKYPEESLLSPSGARNCSGPLRFFRLGESIVRRAAAMMIFQ